MVCATLPLKLMVPVDDVVNVPPLPKLPPTFTVPAPVEVNLACAAVPLNVMEPVTVIVPVLTLTVAKRPAVALPGIAMLAALRMPAPTIRFVVAAVGAVMVTAPLMFRVIPELIVTPFPPTALLAAIVRVEASASAVTVTIWPLAMVTLSPATGIIPPTHVAVTSQLPVAAEVIFAACTSVFLARKSANTRGNRIEIFLI